MAEVIDMPAATKQRRLALITAALLGIEPKLTKESDVFKETVRGERPDYAPPR